MLVRLILILATIVALMATEVAMLNIVAKVRMGARRSAGQVDDDEFAITDDQADQDDQLHRHRLAASCAPGGDQPSAEPRALLSGGQKSRG